MDETAKTQAKERLESQRSATSSALLTLGKGFTSQDAWSSFVKTQVDMHKDAMKFWESLLSSAKSPSKMFPSPKADQTPSKQLDPPAKVQTPTNSDQKVPMKFALPTPPKAFVETSGSKKSAAASDEVVKSADVTETLKDVEGDTLASAKRPLGQKGRRLPGKRDAAPASSSTTVAKESPSPAVKSPAVSSPAVATLSPKHATASPNVTGSSPKLEPVKVSPIAAQTKPLTKPETPPSSSSSPAAANKRASMFGAGPPGGLGAAMNNELLGKLKKRTSDVKEESPSSPQKGDPAEKPKAEEKSKTDTGAEAPVLPKRPLSAAAMGGTPVMPVMGGTGAGSGEKPAWMVNLQKNKSKEKEKEGTTPGPDAAKGASTANDELAAMFARRLKKSAE